MPVIETHDLTKRYRKLVAVDRISFTVERGQVFGFLGPNGSGKTTTIGMLLGIITPTGGSFRLLGREGARGLHEARRRIGATLETPNFYPYLSGRDNLRLAANIKGVPERSIDEVLEVVGLTARQKDKFSAYSLGMKQRLSLAATMLGDPELILLDEPANGLDPEGMREIRDIIRLLAARGKTIFLSSHLLHEVERTCTHVAVIKQGRILRVSAVPELLAARVLAAVQGGDVATLRAIVGDYPDALGVTVREDTVLVELKNGDLSALNAFIAARGIYVSHLALSRQSLEDVFMEMTAEATATAGNA